MRAKRILLLDIQKFPSSLMPCYASFRRYAAILIGIQILAFDTYVHMNATAAIYITHRLILKDASERRLLFTRNTRVTSLYTQYNAFSCIANITIW